MDLENGRKNGVIISIIISIIIVGVFYFSARYSEERSKSQIKTKEELLEKLTISMRYKNVDNIEALCSGNAFEELTTQVTDKEFEHTILYKSISKNKVSSPWDIWSLWSKSLEHKAKVKWEKGHNNQYNVSFPEQGVTLVVDDSTHSWKLWRLYLTMAE